MCPRQTWHRQNEIQQVLSHPTAFVGELGLLLSTDEQSEDDDDGLTPGQAFILRFLQNLLNEVREQNSLHSRE